MKPSVLRRQDSLQLTYDVPHHILSSEVYPCQAPNGSTIVIYGHEDGLRILWRGGKPFKKSTSSHKKANLNGITPRDSMVIDLDEDEPDSIEPTPGLAEFDDEDEEIDISQPYPMILRSINIPFGVAARNLAVPNIPSHIFQSSVDAYPPIYSTHVVVAAACDDFTVRLVSLPLAPPAQDAEEFSSWGVRIVKVGPSSHQDLISSITVTHTSLSADSADQVSQGKSRSGSRSRIANMASDAGSPKGSEQWYFLIASTSPTAGGLLLVHQIPSTSSTALSTIPESHVLLQRLCFRSCLIGAIARFNPSPYPADRHSNILITLPDSGCVKIYQALTHPSSAYSRGRRGSATTVDSTTSSSRSLSVSASRPGKLLITMYAGFIESTDSISLARRKRVLDATWVLSGRAILALLEDGEWGVWDIEGVGPASASSKNLFKGQDSACRVQGGALTRFSFNGFIAPPADEAPKTQQPEAKHTRTGRLAPMTPHTRKVRSDGLFQGNNSRNSYKVAPGRFPRGRISVRDNQTMNTSTSVITSNESILLSIRNVNLWIPSLLSLWRANSTAKGSMDSSEALRPFPFSALQLGGEDQRSVAILPCPSKAFSSATSGPGSGRLPDILISTDSRFILLVSPISESQTSAPTSQGVDVLAAKTNTDQLLLTHGELDIDGMDRILDNMTSRNSHKNMELDLDDDGDFAGMGTPTPKSNGRLARAGATPGAIRGGRVRRELFT